jgi:hypothetical protein
MIGLSKYFDLILVIAIIFNTKYYRALFLGVIFLSLLNMDSNLWNFRLFATLLSITLYSLAKLMFVVKRLQLYPFTNQTLYSIP